MVTDRLTVELVALDNVHADPKNPKDHDVGAIMESIRRYGFVDPVIIDQRTGYLLSGHGRADALRGLRSEQPNEPPDGIVLSAPPQCRWLVPTIHVRSRDGAHARALLIALNRTVELGGWDDAALTELLADLARTNDGLAGTGYDGDDLDALLAALVNPDDFQPEPDDSQPRLDERTPIECGACGATIDPNTGEPK